MEITDRDALRTWLASCAGEVAAAIATRTTMRVLPIVQFYVVGASRDRAAELVLPLFRALATSRVATTWPTRAAELPTDIAAAAAIRAHAVASGVAGTVDADTVDAAAARTAARVAAAVADAADAAGKFTNDARGSADAAAEAVSVAAITAGRAAAAGAVWRAVSEDLAILKAGSGASGVMRHPLWPAGTPTDVSAAWSSLSQTMLSLGERWHVWTEWYEDALRGADRPGSRPLVEGLEVAKVLIPDRDWSRGPAHVNALIERQGEEYSYSPSALVEPGTTRPLEHAEAVTETRKRVRETHVTGRTVLFTLGALRRDNETPVATDEYDALLALVRELVERIARLEADLAEARIGREALEVELDRLKAQAMEGKGLLDTYLESVAKEAGARTVTVGVAVLGIAAVSLPLLWDHVGPMVGDFFSKAEALPMPLDAMIDI